MQNLCSCTTLLNHYPLPCSCLQEPKILIPIPSGDNLFKTCILKFSLSNILNNLGHIPFLTLFLYLYANTVNSDSNSIGDNFFKNVCWSFHRWKSSIVNDMGVYSSKSYCLAFFSKSFTCFTKQPKTVISLDKDWPKTCYQQEIAYNGGHTGTQHSEKKTFRMTLSLTLVVLDFIWF